MAKSVQFRRGSTVSHMSFVGRQGEITVDTDKKTVCVHDEMTAGGFPLLKEDLSNLNNENLTSKGIALSNLSNITDEDIINKGIALYNLSNVSELCIKEKGFLKDDLSNISEEGNASEEKSGIIKIATQSEIENGTSNSSAITPLSFKRSLSERIGYPKGHIRGFKYCNYSENSTKEMLVEKGCARSSDNTCDIDLLETITKKINLPFEKGSGAGGLASSLTLSANKLYYMFALLNPNTGETDIGYDESYNCENLIINSYGFTKYRRIGRLRTDGSSNIVTNSICYELEDGAIVSEVPWTIIDTRALSVASYEISPNVGYGKNFYPVLGMNIVGVLVYISNPGGIRYVYQSQTRHMCDSIYLTQEKLKIRYERLSTNNAVEVMLYGYIDPRRD